MYRCRPGISVRRAFLLAPPLLAQLFESVWDSPQCAFALARAGRKRFDRMRNQQAEQEFRTAAEQLLQADRAGSTEALAQLLEQARHYLLAVANEEMTGALQARAGRSDEVPDTLAEAVCLFVRFTGSSAEELRLWLLAILRDKGA